MPNTYQKGNVFETTTIIFYMDMNNENLNAFKSLLKKGNIDIDAINKQKMVY
jgi:hypothetical protein